MSESVETAVEQSEAGKVDIKFVSSLNIMNCRRRLEQYNRTLPTGCLTMISEVRIVTSTRQINQDTFHFAIRQQYRSRLDMLRDNQYWLWSPLLVSGYIHRVKQRETLVIARADYPFPGRFKIFAIHMVPAIFLWLAIVPLYLQFQESFLLWVFMGGLMMAMVAVYTWYLTALDRASLMGVARDAFGYIPGTTQDKEDTQA